MPLDLLSEQKGFLDHVLDAIPIGISVLAPDGTTLCVNQWALDRIGSTLEEVKGKGHVERTCHPDDLDRILDERRMGLSKGVPFELEMRLLPRTQRIAGTFLSTTP